MTNPVAATDLAAALGPLAPPDADVAEVCAAVAMHHAPAVRLNTLGRSLDAAEFDFLADPVPWFAGRAYWAQPDVRPATDPRFGAGAYYLQDAGSLLPVALLGPQPGQIVCDLCASPGGKATALLECLGDCGALIVNEPVRTRLGPLALNLARHGGARWLGYQRDPDALADQLGPVCDAVLVDAPCTGQSLIARGKQSRRAFDPKRIAHAAARQQRILDAAVRLLRAGGHLVYATCTFAWEENEARIAGLLTRYPQLAPAPNDALASCAVPDPAPPACYRLWPHRDRCAGAFAARLVATDAPATPPQNASHRRDKSRTPARKTPRVPAPPFDDWGRWTSPITLDTRRERAFAWPNDLGVSSFPPPDFGPEVAHIKGRTWFPAYALAMRRDTAFTPRHHIALDAPAARAFLTGQNLPTPDASDKTHGWAVATLDDLALGWLKADAHTRKNHLPKPARLPL
jgi:16S rRNA C967 or C1407 C5-methylase (RsmB/RsmF family)